MNFNFTSHVIKNFQFLKNIEDFQELNLCILKLNTPSKGYLTPLSKINFIDDGVNTELDFYLLESVRKICNVPLLYGGGIREYSEIEKLVNLNFDGVCISHALHKKKISILDIKNKFRKTLRECTYK